MTGLGDFASVLLVHAHPDDETITTGALIASLVARGQRVSLLTATRGERGDVVPGPLSRLVGTVELSREREGELAAAAGILGISNRVWLGEGAARQAGRPPRRYLDSGMSWIRPGLAGPAPDSGPDALTSAGLDEVTADVAALVDHLRPDLVISYDDGGGYGHPDHVRVHDATIAACRAAGTSFAEISSRTDAPAAISEGAEWFALDAHRATVTAALRRYASQLTVTGNFITHSGGQCEPITLSLGLRFLTP